MQGVSSNLGQSSLRSRTSGRNRLGSQEGAPPSSVRRKRHRVRDASQRPVPEIGLESSSPIISEETPSDCFVILRQWGAEITVAVSPPLYRYGRRPSDLAHYSLSKEPELSPERNNYLKRYHSKPYTEKF